MCKCPDTAPEIREQLCSLHYLPHHTRHCASVTACNAHFDRWLNEEEEVQELHFKYVSEKIEQEILESED